MLFIQFRILFIHHDQRQRVAKNHKELFLLSKKLWLKTKLMPYVYKLVKAE